MTRARSASVALLSAATLAFEILLVRAFAIQQFHHFATMAIGVAMLGFGASGALVAAVGGVSRERAERGYRWSALAAALGLLVSPLFAFRIPLDPARLPWDPAQWSRLALLDALLALPFALGALPVLLALAASPERRGLLYGASFTGAGVGAAVSLGILTLLPPAPALAAPAALAALGALCAAGSVRAIVPAVLALALAGGAIARPPWSLTVTPYKSLPQAEAYPDARRIAERSGPTGWLVALEAPALHYAPGLSLAFEGEVPRQTGLFVDGQSAGAVTTPPGAHDDTSTARAAGRPGGAPWAQRADGREFLDWLPSAMPHALGGRDRVLIPGAGEAVEIEIALRAGAREITAVELDGNLMDLVRGLTARSWPAARGSAIRWVEGDARSFVERTGERYDLIGFGAGGAMGTSAAGVLATGEDFLHTVEAYVGDFERLSDGGVLAVTRWLSVPPRAAVRSILTVGEALRRFGCDPARGLVVSHGWGTVTVLAKPSGFTASELDTLERWCRARGFDLDWHPGILAPSPAPLNDTGGISLFEVARTAVTGSAAVRRFASEHPFDVAPVGDARPYPHHFLRVRSVVSFLRSGRGDWLPFAEWGSIALIATLVQCAALAALLLLIPALAGLVRRVKRARSEHRPVSGRGGAPWLAVVGYFAAIGVGYGTAEIAALQQLGLLLGHPVFAVTAVLTVMLVSSGLGSAWSDRILDRPGILQAGLAAGLVVCGLLLLPAVHLLEPLPLATRAVAVAVLLGPLAFVMGCPFPLGLRALAGADPGRVAWAWAANGFASVVAVPFGALLALERGMPVVFGLAAIVYAGAAALAWGYARSGRGSAGSSRTREVSAGTTPAVS